MRKISFAALASLIAISSAAQAQSIDLNSMPLGNVPQKLDAAETGSIASGKVLFRTIERDGVSLTQRYTVAEDGKETVLSEQAQ